VSNSVAIISASGPAHVGDLYVILSAVGELESGYLSRLIDRGNIASRRHSVHLAEETGGFGLCARATVLTVPS